MSCDTTIRIKDLSKCYQIYDQPRDRLKQFLLPRAQRFLGLEPELYYREFWALRDVSFDVRKGETVGIVGRNGSGKSTLLQIICGTLNATAGSVESEGRIAALLELGSGFNPEFTGLENVYLNASVLGLSAQEIDKRLDSILAFAEIGNFINQPIKTLSSGMVVRLAFSVAINTDPQILVIDEALSVGDELFQRKCFSRIAQIKERGATILFVSHSGSTVVELCDRALVLDKGETVWMGPAKLAIGKYQRLIYAPPERQEEIRNAIRLGQDDDTKINLPTTLTTVAPAPDDFYDPNLIPQSLLSYEAQGARIESAKILTTSGRQVNCLTCGETYRYIYTVRFSEGATRIRFGMLIKTMTGLELGGAISAPTLLEGIPYVSPNTEVTVQFTFKCTANPGVYFMNAGVLGIRQEVETYLHRVLDIAMFKVMPKSNDTATALVDFECVPEITMYNPAQQGALAK
ncbi:MAG: transporter related protein [Verrucomicrobiaceae bacterium]|nr:transporter related protein [Verrucomicrobiaceae bacterium]